MLLSREEAVVRDPVVDETEALFKEARRRTRRRRLTLLAAALTIVAGGIVVYAVDFRDQTTTARSSALVPAVDRPAFSHQGVLAFVSQGRLWVLDGETGTLTAVSGRWQQAFDPDFSPNGRWLSYTLENGGQVWLARSDGSMPRLVAQSGATVGWLADGRLLAGSGIWQVSPTGALTRVGTRPEGLLAWSRAGGRYVFASDTMVGPFTKPISGVERLQVSSSLTGRRTTWSATRVSFSVPSGLVGAFIAEAVVLPHREGIVFRTDPGLSDIADGSNLYEINARGTKPKQLGATVGLPVAIGSNGSFAITNGENRYAWLTKSVETCSAATARCSFVRTAPGVLSLDPAWSPDGKTLAVVEAPSSSAANIGGLTVQSWYATHSLWTVRQGSSTPSEINRANGASAPIWSANGKSLLYVANDALWLLPTVSSTPVRIESPLFTPGDWPSFYGEVNWPAQFAWLSPH